MSRNQEELQSQTWQKVAQDENLVESDDLAALLHKVKEEAEVDRKDKSIGRRFLRWLDGVVHDYYVKKINRTHRREAEEGHQIYYTNFYFFYLMTRAQRERQKRASLLKLDNKRQRFMDALEEHWEKKSQRREARKKKEEERCEKWAAEHGLGGPSPPEQQMTSMDRWEERLLRVKEFFSL